MRRGDWKVRGYAGAHHPRGAPYGSLLVETVHDGDHSKDTEVDCWRRRAARGEVSKVEVFNLHRHTMETITFPIPSPKARKAAILERDRERAEAEAERQHRRIG